MNRPEGMTALSIGDRVRHVGSKANPTFRERIGVGTVVSVCDSRIRVKWDNVREARNYKAESLERQEGARA